jgi:4-hydroxy-2-oxoheptanedioate aldolase
MGLGSPVAAESLAHLGFDWLVIDQEHASFDASLMTGQLQAISSTPTVPLVRVPWNDGAWIKSALDAGAYGIVVPMVNTRAEAEAAVAATRYPPQGKRRIGGARTSLYGGPDYVTKANDEILLVVMIESTTGVANAKEILSVPGIDAYFIGPSDLCASMGLAQTWEPEYPEFWSALERVQSAASGTGVAHGIHSNGARAKRMVDRGYRFIALGYDLSYLTASAGAALAQARSGGPHS